MALVQQQSFFDFETNTFTARFELANDVEIQLV